MSIEFMSGLLICSVLLMFLSSFAVHNIRCSKHKKLMISRSVNKGIIAIGAFWFGVSMGFTLPQCSLWENIVIIGFVLLLIGDDIKLIPFRIVGYTMIVAWIVGVLLAKLGLYDAPTAINHMVVSNTASTTNEVIDLYGGGYEH